MFFIHSTVGKVGAIVLLCFSPFRCWSASSKRKSERDRDHMHPSRRPHAVAVAPARRNREIRVWCTASSSSLALLGACHGGAAWEPVRPHPNKGDYLAHLKLETVGAEIVDPTDILPRLGLQAVAVRAGTSTSTSSSSTPSGSPASTSGSATSRSTSRPRSRSRPRLSRRGDARVHRDAGPRAMVHLEFFGLPDNVPFSKVRDVVPSRRARSSTTTLYDATKEPLIELLMDNGYAHVRVEGTVIADRAHARATLRLVVDPGRASTFGEIQIQASPIRCSSTACARGSSGRRASRSRTRRSSTTQTAIYGIGLFGSVRVEPSTDDLDRRRAGQDLGHRR